MKHDLIALVDMDGTLCDFDGAMQRDLAELASPTDPSYQENESKPQWLKNREALIMKQDGWWEALEPIQAGFNVLNLMRAYGFKINILTKGPWKAPSGWTEKVQWCRKWVHDASITITEDKGLVYGKVLFDDYPPYIEAWLKWRPRGKVIMPVVSWNEGAFINDPRVIIYDGSLESYKVVSKMLAKLSSDNE